MSIEEIARKLASSVAKTEAEGAGKPAIKVGGFYHPKYDEYVVKFHVNNSVGTLRLCEIPINDKDVFPECREVHKLAIEELDRILKTHYELEKKAMEPEGRVLTCVYCGQEYPQGTPTHGAQVLTDHIKVCEKHPLRAAEAKITLLKAALVGLIGVRTAEELKAMEANIRAMHAPDVDKVAIINAINALLTVMESEAGE